MLSQAHFQLTDEQLAAIRAYVEAKATAYAAEGEDPAWGFTVEFSFLVAFGRSVTVKFDGEQVGFEVE